MLKVNIAQKLQFKAALNAARELAEAESILDSVKDSLAQDDTETQQVLELFGTHKSIQQQQERLIKNKENLKGEVVSREDIRKICLNYNLRCLSTQYYIKAVPFGALNDIKKFREKTLDFDVSKLFIIAPKSHFQTMLVDRRDPVVVYKDGDDFRVVTQFGNDFTVLRRLQGWVSYNKNLICFVFSFLLLTFLAYSLKNHVREGMLGSYYFIASIISSLISILVCAFFNDFIFDNYKRDWNSQPTRLV